MNYRVGMMALVLTLAAAFTGNVQADDAFTGNVQAEGYSFSFSIPHKNLSHWPSALLVGEVDNEQFTISGVVDIRGSRIRNVGNRIHYKSVGIKESFLKEKSVPDEYYAELWLSEENGEKKFSALQIIYNFREHDPLVVTLSKSLSSPDLELTVRASEDFILSCSECWKELYEADPPRAYGLILSLVLQGFFIDDESFHWQAKNF